MNKKVKRGILAVLAVSLMAFLLIGADSCDSSSNATNEAAVNAVSEIQAADQQLTAIEFARLSSAVVAEPVAYPLERENLNRRNQAWSDPNKISYIYLISYGKIMANYTLKGKVSSVDSRLTCTEQLVDDGDGHYNGRSNIHVVNSPALDGSYGTNGGGIFFFTTDGVYVEWNDSYMLCDAPLTLSQPPELVLNVDVNDL